MNYTISASRHYKKSDSACHVNENVQPVDQERYFKTKTKITRTES